MKGKIEQARDRVGFSDSRIVLMTTTAVMATLITIMTAYICHIPTPTGYIHVGDSLIYIAATILPIKYAMLAAAIGGGMADLLTAPMWIIPTVIIKALITIPFSNKGSIIITKRNIVATILAFFISATCYYIVNAKIFGNEVALVSSFIASFAQGAGSAILFIIFGITLDKMKFKTGGKY